MCFSRLKSLGVLKMVSLASQSQARQSQVLHLPGLQILVDQTQFAGPGPGLASLVLNLALSHEDQGLDAVLEMSLYSIQLHSSSPKPLTRDGPHAGFLQVAQAPSKDIATATPIPRCSSCILASSQPIILSKLACIK